MVDSYKMGRTGGTIVLESPESRREFFQSNSQYNQWAPSDEEDDATEDEEGDE